MTEAIIDNPTYLEHIRHFFPTRTWTTCPNGDMT